MAAEELPVADVARAQKEQILRLTYVFSAFTQTRVHLLNTKFHEAIMEADAGNPKQLQAAKVILRRIYSELHGPLVKSKGEASIQACQAAIERALNARPKDALNEVEAAHLVLMEHATKLGFNGQFSPGETDFDPTELLDHSLSLRPGE